MSTFNIIRLTETESTNSYAIELIAKERPAEGSVIRTEFQTKGRGIDSNTWESEKGKNLTFSIILYPDFPAEYQFVLNKAISLGIYDFLSGELPEHRIAIKWPNDIYIGDKKACGILIQNSVIGNKLDYVVVGIGLNVNQTHFTSDAPNPVSMKMVSGKEYDLDDALQKLLQSIFTMYKQVNAGPCLEIENEYLSALYRLMEWHDYEVRGSLIRARITGTSAYGQLMLEAEDGNVVACDLKEVKFILRSI